ncbi:MAG: hypothetical protein WC749_14930, partial [Dehalococcoidia bacterium]
EKLGMSGGLTTHEGTGFDFKGLLEDEVTQLLERKKSVWGEAPNGPPAYRSGHGKERLTLGCGTNHPVATQG